MRTYTRRNTLAECIKPIEGVLGLCRLCLEEAKESVPIFANANDICTSLATRVMICVGYEITYENCLPNMICKQCLQELNNYYEFRKKCNTTYHKLKTHLYAVQNRKAKESNLIQEEEKEKSNLVISSSDCAVNHPDSTVGWTVYPVSQTLCPVSQSVSQTLCPVSQSVSQTLCPVSQSVSQTRCPNQSVSQSVLTSVSQSVKASTGELVLGFDDFPQLPLVNSNPGQQSTLSTSVTVDGTKEGSESLQESVTTLPSIEVCPDITEFLSSVLTELGIVKRDQNNVEIIEECQSIHLEDGDGQQITLEVIQIEEEEQNTKTKKIMKGKTKTVSKEQKDERARCPVCERRFASRTVLARHARVHTGERPFHCARCGASFNQREVLRRHELVHQEVRPFACARCPKSFTQRNALRSHERRHQPPAARPLALHRCTLCPKVFLHASGVSRHMLAHSGQVLACERCGRRFSDRSSLRRHARTQHARAL